MRTGLLLLFLAGSCGLLLPTASPAQKLSQGQIERLIREASTFYDRDPRAKRVSEAKAVSNLLTVATYPDLGVVRKAVASLNGQDIFGNSNRLLHALNQLRELTFTYDNADPHWTTMRRTLVRDGKLHVSRPPGDVTSDRHISPTFEGAPPVRRNLRPFVGQILTPAQYATDKRTHGELEPMPAAPQPDKSQVANLLRAMESARAIYKPGVGNGPMVALLLKIVACPDLDAIRVAGERFVDRHGRDDKAAAVIDPLLELMWFKSKTDRRNDCAWRLFTLKDGKLLLSDKWIYFGETNDDWSELVYTNAALWHRRDVSHLKAGR